MFAAGWAGVGLMLLIVNVSAVHVINAIPPTTTLIPTATVGPTETPIPPVALQVTLSHNSQGEVVVSAQGVQPEGVPTQDATPVVLAVNVDEDSNVVSVETNPTPVEQVEPTSTPFLVATIAIPVAPKPAVKPQATIIIVPTSTPEPAEQVLEPGEEPQPVDVPQVMLQPVATEESEDVGTPTPQTVSASGPIQSTGSPPTNTPVPVAPGQPTNTSVPVEPTSPSVPGAATNTPVVGQPTDVPVATSTPIPSQPTPTSAPPVVIPTATSVPPQPTQVPEVPTSTSVPLPPTPVPQPTPVPPTSVPPPTPRPTNTPSLIDRLFTPFPTFTPRPTLTPRPTITPRPTFTPRPTITPRPPLPTLPPLFPNRP
jgi:hypothetical protein